MTSSCSGRAGCPRARRAGCCCSATASASTPAATATSSTPLVPDGWAVYGLDQRGHGLSGGRRAHLEDYADLLADFDAFRRTVVARHPGLPVFLLGHSMGGQIALAYALDHQDDLAGLVLSAPALAGDVVPKPVVPLLRALGRVAPRLRPAGIDVTKISKDPAVVAAYQADPLVHHGKPTLALGLGIVGQFAVLPERARDADGAAAAAARLGRRARRPGGHPAARRHRGLGRQDRPLVRRASGTRSTTSRSAPDRSPISASGWPRAAEFRTFP